MMRHIRILISSVRKADAFASKESRPRAEPSWSEPAFARRERQSRERRVAPDNQAHAVLEDAE